jgi:uncharacterized protein
MEFDNTFLVAAPADEVWSAMLDVQRVAPCVPGARVVERTGDNAYKVAIKVKVGPVAMTYNGDVEIAEQDPAAHRALLRARAKEARGQGTADATVELRLAAEDGATRGSMHTDVAISGRVAAMGQGVIADVSGRLIETFAHNLAAMLAGEGAPAPEPAPAPAPAPAAAAGAPPPPPPPPPPAPAAEPEEALAIGSLVGGVVSERLRDPRALAAVLVVAAAVGFALGRASRR